MRARVSALWVPRRESSESEYQDAFWPRTPGERCARRLRFALADGATESLLSGRWADMLVRSYCRLPQRHVNLALETARSAWPQHLDDYVRWREGSGRPIRWYEEPGLARGAHATFLGVQFSSAEGASPKGDWTAVAVGDTCLFHVRDGHLLSAFPIDEPQTFSSSPHLIASDSAVGPVERGAEEAQGDWQAGDSFFLVTDALACWFLQANASGTDAGQVLAGLAGQGDGRFRSWVEDRRLRGELADDDVTAVGIDVL